MYYYQALQYMSTAKNCDIGIESIIAKYIKFGWLEMVDIFNHNKKVAKEKMIHSDISEKLLRMLGCIREYYVDTLFNCVNDDPDTIYKSFGSSNVTSDYDLTITGRNAPTVAWNMFKSFLEKYGNSLAQSFDTNIYCVGYYGNVGLRKGICQEVNDISITPISSDSDIDDALAFSFLKLADISSLELMATVPKMQNILKQMRQHKKLLDTTYAKAFERTKQQYPKITADKTIELITKYKLNTQVASELYKILYGTADTRNIYLLSSIANYYAVEAYYTCATINVVVMELQGNKQNLGLNPIEYVCSTIENLGDFRNHVIEHGSIKSDETMDMLIKLSKYIFRIFYSLSKIYPKYIPKKENILTNVIKERGAIKILTKTQLESLDYTEDSIIKYVDKITEMVLTDVFAYLNGR